MKEHYRAMLAATQYAANPGLEKSLWKTKACTFLSLRAPLFFGLSRLTSILIRYPRNFILRTYIVYCSVVIPRE
jgi:hypothetical protein